MVVLEFLVFGYPADRRGKLRTRETTVVSRLMLGLHWQRNFAWVKDAPITGGAPWGVTLAAL
jgi:hypothetical protein